MNKILKQLFVEEALTAIYSNKNDYDKFMVGYIIKLANDRILMKNLSMRGEFDGYTVFPVQEILKIIIDDTACIDLDLLYKMQG